MFLKWQANWCSGDDLKMIGHSVVTLGGRDSGQPVLRYPLAELFESLELYSKDGLEMGIHRWHWGRDSAWPLFRSPRRQLFELIWYFSWEEGLEIPIYVTLRKTAHSLFRSPRRFDMIVLSRTWSWNGPFWWHWGRLHFHCSSVPGVWLTSSNQYDSFTWKEVLKWQAACPWYWVERWLLLRSARREPQVSRILSRRWPWNGCSLAILEKTLYTTPSWFRSLQSLLHW